eukprot:TRINITY_DN388_c0_g2_i1.p1 TRINITY_DN388_c0_g2~~TRINITY_DN388_c0_g2_i1.p1  ORF type:complete len:607 (+),score=266.47 TRINITY_DN388_c0_g2_i1:59-1822(+)
MAALASMTTQTAAPQQNQNVVQLQTMLQMMQPLVATNPHLANTFQTLSLQLSAMQQPQPSLDINNLDVNNLDINNIVSSAQEGESDAWMNDFMDLPVASDGNTGGIVAAPFESTPTWMNNLIDSPAAPTTPPKPAEHHQPQPVAEACMVGDTPVAPRRRPSTGGAPPRLSRMNSTPQWMTGLIEGDSLSDADINEAGDNDDDLMAQMMGIPSPSASPPPQAVAVAASPVASADSTAQSSSSPTQESRSRTGSHKFAPPVRPRPASPSQPLAEAADQDQEEIKSDIEGELSASDNDDLASDAADVAIVTPVVMAQGEKEEDKKEEEEEEQKEEEEQEEEKEEEVVVDEENEEKIEEKIEEEKVEEKKEEEKVKEKKEEEKKEEEKEEEKREESDSESSDNVPTRRKVDEEDTDSSSDDDMPARIAAANDPSKPRVAILPSENKHLGALPPPREAEYDVEVNALREKCLRNKAATKKLLVESVKLRAEMGKMKDKMIAESEEIQKNKAETEETLAAAKKDRLQSIELLKEAECAKTEASAMFEAARATKLELDNNVVMLQARAKELGVPLNLPESIAMIVAAENTETSS